MAARRTATPGSAAVSEQTPRAGSARPPVSREIVVDPVAVAARRRGVIEQAVEERVRGAAVP
jgi:hypothetical protein